MEPRKQAILNALRAFTEQRPGLDPCNYISHGRDTAGVAAYRTDSRRITQDLADVRTLLAYVSGQDAITADMLLAEAGSGGRLTLVPHCRECDTHGNSPEGCSACLLPTVPWTRVTVDWCTGQYWCVEYRAGVARFLSAVLWAHVREHVMPPPLAGEGDRMYSGFEIGHKSPTAMSGGDWLRAHFKREFGRRIGNRYFD